MNDQMKIKFIANWLGSGSINLFGRPLSGKDSQGKRLAELFHGNLISGGDILRNSDIPVHVREALDAGNLVPTDDYIKIVLPYLSREYLSNQPLILSSVGRWHGEEDGVIQVLEKSNHDLKAVVYLDISEDEAIKRYYASQEIADRHNRADDDIEKLTTRFAEFNNKTLPVIDFYKNRGLLIEIDGIGSRDAITDNIINNLYDFVNLASASP